ncbi:hypothetical protein [Flavobacterium sp. MDT1-60]|uniref:hypothetical protein n=1 Tax=Flavobacterium sp. MDT1-60 TaxID=1979344 RepID=UPI001783B398|nr:hypothetical protein [Flavobacterium sp. MDT1-60]QOG03481.1 hypothetical protein IHE43_04350 [Flavobacterium sp. MDT1-60]
MKDYKKFDSPNDFYKNMRPEFFSDSETVYKIELTREVLAFEIETISTNQKQDQFEILARKLAEMYIAPNLIPQVGPTGGGDGKTDSETYPVSQSISDRWFTPENGWNKNENWAFAISSKKDWKGKLKLDIKSIISTCRGYTKIYFFTNQKIPSKKKKDTQDEFIKEFEIDVIILDGEWIIEKIINNKLIDLAVDSLNLSDVYKSKQYLQGENDTYRREKLIELENKINTPNRYFEIDYQLVEDCLDSAIISRELEDSREIIEGKFSRAIRFAKKLKNTNQLCRIYYQQAWTAIFWFNDFEEFINAYINFREKINSDSNIYILQHYSTLYTVLNSHAEFEDLINLSEEKELFYLILNEKIEKTRKSTSSLEAETYLCLNTIFENIRKKQDCDNLFLKLHEIIIQVEGHLSYPFEQIYKSIQVFGQIFPNSDMYDALIEECAKVNGKRNSDLATSDIYIKRAIEKFKAKLYQDSIKFLGKAIVKLSKNESKKQLILSLRMLSISYRNIGLLWASHNCLIFACSLSLKTWFKEGYLDNETYYIAIELAKNEILLGRIPSLLCVCELINVLSKLIDVDDEENRQGIFNDETLRFIDITLANRFLNSNEHKEFELIPDVLSYLNLEFSTDALLYKLGYVEKIIESVDNVDFKSPDLDDFMSSIASQPIKEQFVYKTDFVSSDEIVLYSKVLGTNTELRFKKDEELFFISEAFLAFIESFFSTSLNEIMPTTENVFINLIQNSNIDIIKLLPQEKSNEFTIEVNKFNFFERKFSDELWRNLLDFLSNLMQQNFLVKDVKMFLDNLFNKEEVFQRVSMVFSHDIFCRDFYGEKPKIFLENWYDKEKHKTYNNIRTDDIQINIKDVKIKKSNELKETSHNLRNVSSIIDIKLWDSAQWQGFGLFINKNYELGIVLCFKDILYGEKIFDGWLSKLGNLDFNEEIRLSIIKGIDSNNPHWYRVHICKEMREHKEDVLFTSVSKLHTLHPVNSANLDNLIQFYNAKNKYKIYPASIDSEGAFRPDLSRGIEKTKLVIKEAWEISLNDIDSAAILKNDKIIIPKNIQDAPILEVLRMKE